MNYELDVGVLMWLVSRASRIFPRMRMHPVFDSVEDVLAQVSTKG